MMSMDIKEIMENLPHRYPFLLIDRIEEMELGKRVVAIKNVTMNEPFFQGHFPGYPLFPGVLMVEAMAQAVAVMAIKTVSGGGKKISTYFMGIERAKFRKPVVPGDQLRLEVNVLKNRREVWKLSGRAFVGDTLVAEADFTAMVTDKEI